MMARFASLVGHYASSRSGSKTRTKSLWMNYIEVSGKPGPRLNQRASGYFGPVAERYERALR